MKKIEDAVRRLGGVWPSDDADAVYLYRIDDRYIAGLPGGTALHICTRTEFEECTRRLRNEPSLDDAPDWAVAKAQDNDGWWYWLSATGEAIGDWKQTLRLRPEEKKVESKDDWHEKGEFPPVGTVCEVVYDGTWEQTKIIGWDDDKIVFTTPFDDITSYDGIVANPNIFRPLQTERERWVEMARKATFEADEKQNYYEAIYDAGLAKMPVGE